VLYRIEVSHTSHHQIRRLPEQSQLRVNQAIASLAENPRPQGSKKLTAKEGYRIRVGDYRILNQIDDAAKLVIVYRVAARGDVYKY
jgi:mRNA interferase RelE/StbE